MSEAVKMMDAMTYQGRNRLTNAWLMFQAIYAYTRSWNGSEGPDGAISCGRWYSFCAAVSVGWKYLWERR